MKTPTLETVAFTAGGAAEACGLPRQQIDHAIKVGELPATKSGRRMIVLKEDLLAWLRQCREHGRIPAPISDASREKLAALNRARSSQSA